ncbi:MAG: transglutaminase family protein, partial [Burkholderiaceae bacterium]
LRTLSQPDSGNRLLRFDAEAGSVRVDYRATVDLRQHLQITTALRETPVTALPDSVLPYLLASRYCESDKLLPFAWSQFGATEPGYARAEAVAQWVRQHVEFKTGVSRWTTSAADTFDQRRGVCRDFAHLMIALCRALNMPARFVTGVDYGADPTLGAPDFHAYVEVFLSGRWYLFDPTDISPTTGLLRIGTGRDAADVPFAHIFGNVHTGRPAVTIEAVVDASAGFELPSRTALAVCTAESPLPEGLPPLLRGSELIRLPHTRRGPLRPIVAQHRALSSAGSGAGV